MKKEINKLNIENRFWQFLPIYTTKATNKKKKSSIKENRIPIVYIIKVSNPIINNYKDKESDTNMIEFRTKNR
jgi:hypothetical protein